MPAQATPIAPIGPRPGRAVHLCDREAQQGRDHGRRRGEYGRPGGAHRRAHRLVAVRGAVQLLAVPRHDQQRIVRARAQYQDRHDRARLPVDRDAQLRDAVADRAGEDLREDDRRQRDEQEDRRAVDQDQQHDHERERRQQQRAVDVLEDLDRVRGVARAARDLHLETPARIRNDIAPRVDRVDDPVAVALALQVGGHDRRLAVRRADRAHEGRVARGLTRDRRGGIPAALRLATRRAARLLDLLTTRRGPRPVRDHARKALLRHAPDVLRRSSAGRPASGRTRAGRRSRPAPARRSAAPRSPRAPSWIPRRRAGTRSTRCPRRP